MYIAPVKPLRLLSDGYLPNKIKKKFDNMWRPILELMHSEVEATVETTPEDKVDDAFIRATYDLALRNVCIKYPDIAVFLRGGGHKVSTCSKAVKADKTKKRKAAWISM